MRKAAGVARGAVGASDVETAITEEEQPPIVKLVSVVLTVLGVIIVMVYFLASEKEHVDRQQRVDVVGAGLEAQCDGFLRQKRRERFDPKTFSDWDKAIAEKQTRDKQEQAIRLERGNQLKKCNCAPTAERVQLMPANTDDLCNPTETTIASYPAETVGLLKSFQVCGECMGGAADLQRVGDDHDGGYLMCNTSLRGAKNAFSIGINGWDGWGVQLAADYGMPVEQYDCTNLKVPTCGVRGFDAYMGGVKYNAYAGKCKGLLHFHPICVETRESTLPKTMKLMSLEQMVAAAGMGQSKDLVLKIDPEGAEWDALDMASDQTLAQFRTIAVEFHHLDTVESRWLCSDPEPGNPAHAARRHPKMARILQKILRQFRIVHTHGNALFSMAAYGPYRVSPIIEVTFVRNDLSRPVPCHTAIIQPADQAVGAVEQPLGRLPRD